MKQSITASEMGKPVTLSRLTELTGSTKVSTRISDLRMHGYVIHNTRTTKKINGELVYVSKYALVSSSILNTPKL